MFPLSLAIAQFFPKKSGGAGGTGTLTGSFSGALPTELWVYFSPDAVADNSDLAGLELQVYTSLDTSVDITTWFRANGAGYYIIAPYGGSTSFTGVISAYLTSETPGGVTTITDLYCRDSANLPSAIDAKVQSVAIADGDALIELLLDFPS